MSAFVITKSRVSAAGRPVAWPIPSRMVLPRDSIRTPKGLVVHSLTTAKLDFVTVDSLWLHMMILGWWNIGASHLPPTSSRSTSIQSAVSPRRTLSPVVGPNIATYTSRPISVS